MHHATTSTPQSSDRVLAGRGLSSERREASTTLEASEHTVQVGCEGEEDRVLGRHKVGVATFLSPKLGVKASRSRTGPKANDLPGRGGIDGLGDVRFRDGGVTPEAHDLTRGRDASVRPASDPPSSKARYDRRKSAQK